MCDLKYLFNISLENWNKNLELGEAEGEYSATG